MKRRTLLAAASTGLTTALAGCGSSGSGAGRPAGEQIGVEDDETEIEVDGDVALWTWRGDLNPPMHDAPCDVTVTVAVFDEAGERLREKTTILRDVESDQNLRTVQIVDDPELIGRITTYDVTVEDRDCSG